MPYLHLRIFGLETFELPHPSLYVFDGRKIELSFWVLTHMESDDDAGSVALCLHSPEFAMMWLVFFFNIAAGISVISFQSSLLQDVWGLADPSIEPQILAEYGATLIAVSSLCNGVGRLFWGLLSDRIGPVRVFRILLAMDQMVVFGVLMTERDPWVFAALVCYVLLCLVGGFATMPSTERATSKLRSRRLRCQADVGDLRGRC